MADLETLPHFQLVTIETDDLFIVLMGNRPRNSPFEARQFDCHSQFPRGLANQCPSLKKFASFT